MQFELPKDKSSIIKVIGVGGGGSNAVNHMYRQGIKDVDFVICNTDQQALDISEVPLKVALGASLTEGRGAGAIAEVGKNAAIENLEEIRDILADNTKMVFITAGMGGGTGTGAAPVIAKLAREMNILTVGIVTIPFTFEGKKRKLQADEGLNALKESVDTLLVISNDKLREIYGNLTLKSAFGKADDILTIAAKGIAEIITVTGYVNVDFEDVKTVMTESGVAIMGSASADGEGRAIEAVKSALESPLLNDNNISGAKYVLLNIASGTNEVTMDEISEITDHIQEAAGMNADIIWGNCTDETLGEKLSVTIIATGFKTSKELGIDDKVPTRKVNILTADPVIEKFSAPVIEAKVEAINSTEELNEDSIEALEPTLKVSTLESENTQTVEFEIPTAKHKDEVINNPGIVPFDARHLDRQLHNTSEDNKQAADRINLLRSMSLSFNSPAGLSNLEKEPAYKRKNINLQAQPHSSETQISRYSLTEDEEKKTELKPNNPYLHDNVD